MQDFYNIGFIKLKDPQCHSIIEMDTMNWGTKGSVGLRVQSDNPGIDVKIAEMQSYIEENILKKYWNTVIVSRDDVEIVDGMDAATVEWHHDYFEGQSNCGVLVYYDTMIEATGGSLSIKKADDDTTVNTIYPAAGDIVILNQGTDFLHKVNRMLMGVPRRVALFHYWVE